MTRIFATSLFFSKISELEKKPKDGYCSCTVDIIEFLKNKDTVLLWNHISTEKDITAQRRLKKSRIPDSFQNKSSKDGYRLVYVLDKETETITNGCMCSVLPLTYFNSKHKRKLAKLTYTTCYRLFILKSNYENNITFMC